ncbi:NAD(P)-binding domain-containing protein [Helicobacter labetoulli]|uniref:NAD(P)-binding domain-containing protein n=1 Tax=Helicobacter labetoulli TaxID=2315333 RepID=UPI000EF70844|nr:NAD(P)-binding domain-containing protein [Helicobacter labetoulli]
MNTIYDVIVIGCGPAGMSAALEARAKNLSVLVLEKGESHNMSIRKFYKEGKRVDRDYKGQVVELKGELDFQDGNRESTLEFFDTLLKPINVEYQSDVESVSQSDGIFSVNTSDNRSFKARFVIIGIGKMGQPNKPSYAIPPTIRKSVNFNANDARSEENILVVGGGNSAVEYAIDLAQNTQGGSVTLNYRRKEFTRINDINAKELESALSNGQLMGRFGIDIIELSDEDGKVAVKFSDESKEVFDRVIYAIGGATPVDFLKKCGIQTDEKGVPLVSQTLESSVKNIFVAGDIALKSGGSIALAIKHSYDIMNEIAKRTNL